MDWYSAGIRIATGVRISTVSWTASIRGLTAIDGICGKPAAALNLCGRRIPGIGFFATTAGCNCSTGCDPGLRGLSRNRVVDIVAVCNDGGYRLDGPVGIDGSFKCKLDDPPLGLGLDGPVAGRLGNADLRPFIRIGDVAAPLLEDVVELGLGGQGLVVHTLLVAVVLVVDIAVSGGIQNDLGVVVPAAGGDGIQGDSFLVPVHISRCRSCIEAVQRCLFRSHVLLGIRGRIRVCGEEAVEGDGADGLVDVLSCQGRIAGLLGLPRGPCREDKSLQQGYGHDGQNRNGDNQLDQREAFLIQFSNSSLLHSFHRQHAGDRPHVPLMPSPNFYNTFQHMGASPRVPLYWAGVVSAVPKGLATP